MTLWTWVLVGLCALAVILALVPVYSVVRLTRRLRSRVDALQQARLFASLESLNLQRARLESIAAKAAPLAVRAQAAVASLKSSTQSSGLPEMRDAMQSAGAEIDSLAETLR